MTDTIALSFDRPPSFFPAYRRALFGRRPGLEPGQTLPAITATCKGIAVEEAALQEYIDACGIGSEPGLPVCYPHVVASALHVNMFTHRAFPFGLMGAVHLRNHAVRYRAIQPDEKLDLECAIVAQRFRPQGFEFDVDTRLIAGSDLVWREISTFMIRKKFETGDPVSPLADVFPWPDDEACLEVPGQEVDRFVVPARAGKRYAHISGDYNPIHVSRILAKLFGFERDLVHGMWGVARATAGLEQLHSGEPVRVDVAFKGPLYMSHEVAVKAAECPGGTSLRLYCGKEPRPAVLVVVRRAAADSNPEEPPA